MYLRALVWVAACAWALDRSTGNRKVARAYGLAHLAALGLGVVTDFALFAFAPPELLTARTLQCVFFVPIAIFTVISLWIGNWERPVTAADALACAVPIGLWGLLVVHGWQAAWDGDVLGAWFSSAAAGAVDLYARYGPPGAARRPWLVRLAGYPAVVLSVYLLLPRTELW